MRRCYAEPVRRELQVNPVSGLNPLVKPGSPRPAPVTPSAPRRHALQSFRSARVRGCVHLHGPRLRAAREDVCADG